MQPGKRRSRLTIGELASEWMRWSVLELMRKSARGWVRRSAGELAALESMRRSARESPEGLTQGLVHQSARTSVPASVPASERGKARVSA